MKTLIFVFSIIGFSFLLLLPAEEQPFVVDDKASVAELLEELGDAPIAHKVNKDIPGSSVERGADLVLRGITIDAKGKKTVKQSKHFVCTSCHNIQREDPDLSVADPQARLEYAAQKGLPFLQGSALYGAVNRTKFYNDDYFKKYGALVDKARSDIREAIQLCAIECSQGRPLKDWEMESVLAYLWSIDLKLGDLNLEASEKEMVENAAKGQANKQTAIDLLKSKYLDGSPATFVDPPKDRKSGYENISGDATNGKLVYDLSCKHCHEGKRYSMFNLDDSAFSFKHLKKHFPKYTRYSVYQVSRYGTSPINGKRSYMPNYTLQKLSNQQLEDLRAYIDQEASK